MEKRPKGSEQEPKKQKILITGSKGTIGTVLLHSLQEDFEIIQLDRETDANDTTEFSADIADPKSLEQAFKKIGKVDCIVHLAASASTETPWEEILRNNIIGTRNIYECARKFEVKKIIFASTTHLVAYEGYPQTSPFGRPIEVNDPPRPDSDYGASKGFGEMLARQYYDLYGIKTICIRIGSVSKDNKPIEPYEKLWLSHNDVAQVFRKALETDIPFGIYFATSDNAEGIYDLTVTKQDLGYNPVDGTRKPKL